MLYEVITYNLYDLKICFSLNNLAASKSRSFDLKIRFYIFNFSDFLLCNIYLDLYFSRITSYNVCYTKLLRTVAITMYQSYFPFQIEPIDALISELEARDYNVIATYGSDTLLSGDFFQQGDEVLVDAIISFTYFGNKFDAEELA